MSILWTRDESRTWLREQFKGHWLRGEPVDPGGEPHLFSGAFTIMTTDRLYSILEWSKLDLFMRMPSFKCAEFARNLSGEVRTYGRKEWLELEEPYLFGEFISGHGLNFCVVYDGPELGPQLRIIEPQADWVMDLSDDPVAKPGHFGIWDMSAP
jgi:hypothetical protein